MPSWSPEVEGNTCLLLKATQLVGLCYSSLRCSPRQSAIPGTVPECLSRQLAWSLFYKWDGRGAAALRPLTEVLAGGKSGFEPRLLIPSCCAGSFWEQCSSSWAVWASSGREGRVLPYISHSRSPTENVSLLWSSALFPQALKCVREKKSVDNLKEKNGGGGICFAYICMLFTMVKLEEEWTLLFLATLQCSWRKCLKAPWGDSPNKTPLCKATNKGSLIKGWPPRKHKTQIHPS